MKEKRNTCRHHFYSLFTLLLSFLLITQCLAYSLIRSTFFNFPFFRFFFTHSRTLWRFPFCIHAIEIRCEQTCLSLFVVADKFSEYEQLPTSALISREWMTDTSIAKSHISSIKLNFQLSIFTCEHFHRASERKEKEPVFPRIWRRSESKQNPNEIFT